MHPCIGLFLKQRSYCRPSYISLLACSLQFLNSVLSHEGQTLSPTRRISSGTSASSLPQLIQEFAGLQLKNGHIHTQRWQGCQSPASSRHHSNALQRGKLQHPCHSMAVGELSKESTAYLCNPPTRDMIIKPRHRFVDASGLVSAPFLDQWIFPRCHLVELVQNLSSVFGQDPPLYSRPASPRPPHPSRRGTMLQVA
ncbi:hypothetical protein O6H91_15G013200 [Diphasiastrum complanatum]|uniref:Uncharacterized protein n=1 Tax=Diphasiastrum complanatum TaxID=34168 RepID=A0ACC2BFS9_DIPCM|nr:hypothetical protein O6H91_15G013200 [Diphasiastrum complanatum]